MALIRATVEVGGIVKVRKEIFSGLKKNGGMGFHLACYGVDLGRERKTFCNSSQAVSSKSDEQLAVEEAWALKELLMNET